MPATSLTPVEFSSVVTAITSAFGDPTRRDIFLFAHATQGGVTAAETATHFGLHPNVARHHLDKLSSGGYLDVELVRPGGAGRPSKRYRAHDETISLDLEVRHDAVIVKLLGRALEELGVERATQLAEQVGFEHGVEMAESVDDSGNHQRTVRSALHVVAEALSAQGFAAHTEGGNGTLELVAEHCPFGDAVVEHPVICAVDRGMVAGMLSTLVGETSVDLRLSRSRGDSNCVTSVDETSLDERAVGEMPVGEKPVGEKPVDEPPVP